MEAPDRHYWGVITADFPPSVLTAQARQMEEMGAVTTRVKLASGVALAFARSPFSPAPPRARS